MPKLLIFLLLAVKSFHSCNSLIHNKTVLDLRNHRGEECYRACTGQTRTCYFKFVLEHYQAMGVACGKCAQGVIEDCFNIHCIPVDGMERGVHSINRQVPGPSINVCHGDRVVIDVVNMMAGTATTLHWHGLHMRNSQVYDGVPYITQCPIDFGHTFRYKFVASEHGTQFYHSHAGHHKLNGMFGSLVVRNFRDPHSNMYDYDLKEHTILVTDWIHDDAEMFVPGLPTRKPNISPESILINGKGVFFKSDKTPTNSPIEVFKVIPSKKFRFRYINSAGHMCPVQIQFQNHDLSIIATDGHNVVPVTVDTLIATGGERYDFVINANQPRSDYCIKVKLLGNCEGIEGYAILSYSDTLEIKPEEYKKYREFGLQCYNSIDLKEESTMNHPNTTCYDNTDKHHCSADLSGLDVDLNLINAEIDERFYIDFLNHRLMSEEVFEEGRYEHFLNVGGSTLIQSAINNISFAYPSFPILTQTDQLSDEIFCDPDNLPLHCSNVRFCHCTQRVKAKLNSVVEMVLIDGNRVLNRMNHPFHMHGYALTVTEMGQIPGVKEMTVDIYKKYKNENLINKLAEGQIPPIKDTISIPTAGYTVFRFKADNPGFWLLHCHFDHHLATGMTIVLQVGDEFDFPQPPPNFPRCNNYIPEIYDDEL
uniref:CSON002551 protein n=1 Tax=Culicoides sonorensis TaxID=179676 RepID=A0A336MJM4_CULSO